MNDGGGGGERRNLQPFFCFRSNFRAITRLETLATQVIKSVDEILLCDHLNKTSLAEILDSIIYFLLYLFLQSIIFIL